MAIDLPEWLSDRAADGWEPIFAIARAVGGDWLDRALAAARELSAGDAGEDASMGVTLLRDIREIFREKAADRLFTEELLVELNAIEESPWGNWYGRPMTGQGLAKLLRPFQIKPKQVRIGSDTKKGYELDWFRDNFARYLREPETPETPETRSAERTEGAIGNVSDVSLVSHPRGRRQEPPGHLTRYAQQLGLRIVGR
jgi:putative DNA primase/helicase